LIGAVVSTYNHDADLIRFLHCLDMQTARLDHVYVTDDGSTDGTPDILEDWLHGGEGRQVVTNRRKDIPDVVGSHLNYIDGCDTLAHLGCDWIVRLGDDMMLKPDYVKTLVSRMEGDGGLYGSGMVEGETVGFRDGISAVRGCFFSHCRHWMTEPVFVDAVLRARSGMMGALRFYADLTVTGSRPTGTEHDGSVWYWRGRAMRYTGHTLPYVILRAAADRRQAARLLRGWYDMHVNTVDGLEDVRDYTRRQEWARLWDFLRFKP